MSIYAIVYPKNFWTDGVTNVCPELEMEIMASCNSVARVWGLNSIDDYCSIEPTWTLSSSWKRFVPSNLPLLTPHNEPSTTSLCQLCQGGSIESGRRHKNRQKLRKKKIFFQLPILIPIVNLPNLTYRPNLPNLT